MTTMTAQFTECIANFRFSAWLADISFEEEKTNKCEPELRSHRLCHCVLPSQVKKRLLVPERKINKLKFKDSLSCACTLIWILRLPRSILPHYDTEHAWNGVWCGIRDNYIDMNTFLFIANDMKSFRNIVQPHCERPNAIISPISRSRSLLFNGKISEEICSKRKWRIMRYTEN